MQKSDVRHAFEGPPSSIRMKVENSLMGVLIQVLRCSLALSFQFQQCGEAPEPASPAAVEGQAILPMECVSGVSGVSGGGWGGVAVTAPDYVSEPGGGVATRSRPEES